MATQKLYAGAKLREIRGRLSLTQKTFADKLGVSLPYLNQMENNHRPVSASVVLALAQEFGLDVTELTVGESERLVSDMREALADPVFAQTTPPLADLRLAASNAPALARAFLDLHRAYRQTHERLASLDEALGREIATRILAMLINEAADALYLRVASREDIELAMTQGVNYPKGLLAWADEIGIQSIVEKLDSLYVEYLEDRYRCSPLLRKMNRDGKRFF